MGEIAGLHPNRYDDRVVTEPLVPTATDVAGGAVACGCQTPAARWDV